MSYLPGTKIRYAWDSTSLGAFKTCPRFYHLSIVEGWTSRAENIHLRFGVEFHKALQDYDIYKALGAGHEEALRTTTLALTQRTEEWEVDQSTKHGKYKNKHTLRQLAVDYLDHYREDSAKTVIKSDGTPAVELSFQFDLDWGPIANKDMEDNYTYVLCGHLDKVVTFNDQLFVKDVKTSMHTLNSGYFDQYEPNNQMTLYTLAGQMVLKTEVKGIIIDAAQILLCEENRFVRGVTYRTQDQLEEWLADTALVLDAAEVCAARDHWPMNDTACKMCRFREVCSTAPHARERFLRADFTQLPEEERWNPLKAR
jgi:PD-(D/E)XK nuclease superfamily